MIREASATGDVKEYYVDTESEVANIEVAALGSTIYVVNGGIVYMSDGTAWVKQ